MPATVFREFFEARAGEFAERFRFAPNLTNYAVFLLAEGNAEPGGSDAVAKMLAKEIDAFAKIVGGTNLGSGTHPYEMGLLRPFIHRHFRKALVDLFARELQANAEPPMYVRVVGLGSYPKEYAELVPFLEEIMLDRSWAPHLSVVSPFAPILSHSSLNLDQHVRN